MPTSSSSFNRRSMHEFLRGIELRGKVLDIGGTKNAGYLKEPRGEFTVTTVNIDEKYGYDMKFDVEEPFPLEDASYDHVLSLNLLEHTFRYQNVLNECHRVLKPGGTLVQYTPFLAHVHGTPSDYFRYTEFALKKMLSVAGFTDIAIRPSRAGILLAVYEQTYFLLPLSFLRTMYRGVMTMTERLLCRISKKYRVLTLTYVLSYIVIAKK